MDMPSFTGILHIHYFSFVLPLPSHYDEIVEPDLGLIREMKSREQEK